MRTDVGVRPVRDDADPKGIHAPNCGPLSSESAVAVSSAGSVDTRRGDTKRGDDDAVTTDGIILSFFGATNDWTPLRGNRSANRRRMIVAIVLWR
jgi:hypothetical protein